MRSALVTVCLMALGLAGCASTQDAPLRLLPDDSRDPLAFVVPDRQASAEILWHEEPSQDAFTLEGITGADTWEPRDVTMTYHGVQPVLDEWGREVLAFVLRYRPMELVIDEVTFSLDGLSLEGHWEETHREVHFDATDARWMGITDVDREVHAFALAGERDPLTPGYEWALYFPFIFMALGGDLTRGIHLYPGQDYEGDLTFTPDTERPLPGKCDVYKVTFVYDHPPTSSGIAKPNPDGPYRDLVCIESDGWPLWTWSGNDKDHMAITRLSDPPRLPALSGEPLDPLVYPPRAWEDQPILLPVVPPVKMPAGTFPGDWVDQLRPIVQALPTNPEYLTYQQDRDVRLSEAMKSTPHFNWNPILPVIGQIPSPLFDRTSWLFTSDSASDDHAWWFIDSRFGREEDPDIHVNSRGFVFEDSWTYPLRDLVGIGEVQIALEAWAPVNPALLSFSQWPAFDDFDLGPVAATWLAISSCYTPDVERGTFLYISAIQGQMLAAGSSQSTPDGCFTGVPSTGLLMRLAGHDGRLFPPTETQPGFFLSEDGDVVVLGPPLG